MLDFISRFFKKDQMGTKDLAKERLQLVLIHDRGGLPPEVMDCLRDDLLAVISKYMEVEKKDLKMNLDKKEDQVALVANIPVKRVKRIGERA